VAVFLEPGRGKTATALTACVDIGKPRTLVLAPARVAETVWHAEANEWEHTRRLKVLPAVGDRAQRRACIESNADVIVLSYENFPWLLDTVNIPKRFDCVIFDELSRMKNVDTVKFRRFRGSVRDIPFRFGLTGTPVGNHMIDLWGEMYMVAGEKPLGPTKGEYVGRYFDPGAVVNGRVVSWKLRPWAQKEIEARIKPYAFTLPPSLNAPPMPELRIHSLDVPMPAEVELMCDDLYDKLETVLATGEDLYTFSTTTAAVKCRQLMGGAVYLEPPTVLGEPSPKTKEWRNVHGAKLRALEELVGELQGEPLLVAYWFKHEAERILTHFQGRAVALDSAAKIHTWNKRQIEILLVHPASAGHGLNLQFGGHHIAWYTLPWSLEMWKQLHGREVRHGQPSPVVFSHVLLGGKIDRRVLRALYSKAAVEDSVLNAMLL
jgi:hypothetical protein